MKAAAFAVLIALMLYPSASSAGGSFIVDDLRPVLAQSPDIENYLTSSLDLDKSGSANRIGNNVNPRLGGTRLGPYCIKARPRGSHGAYTLIVCINTDYDFRDRNGKQCEINNAYSVKEKFVSVEIKPLSAID